MHVPVLCSRTDGALGAVIMTVSGHLTTCDDVSTLRSTLETVPHGYALIIELDAMTTVTAASLACMRDLALDATRRGIRLILVSESIDVRANLILADLDSLAPVLHTLTQASQIVSAAA